jgi:tRNA ligase
MLTGSPPLNASRFIPAPFPTIARGLFTRENLHPDRILGQGRHAIVARGYDKFFNIDELPSTKVRVHPPHFYLFIY